MGWALNTIFILRILYNHYVKSRSQETPYDMRSSKLWSDQSTQMVHTKFQGPRPFGSG